jgi:hypothetical protein
MKFSRTLLLVAGSVVMIGCGSSDGGDASGVADSAFVETSVDDSGATTDAKDGATDTRIAVDAPTDVRTDEGTIDGGLDSVVTDAGFDSSVVTGCAVAPIITGAPGTPIASWSRITGMVTVDYFGDGYHDVDITKFGEIWRGWTAGAGPATWPGDYGQNASIPLPTNQYVSAELTVPTPYFETPTAPSTLYGLYTIGESDFSAAISMTISTHCGDFGQLSPTTIVPGCVLNAGGADNALAWKKTGACALHDGVTYYLNIINADIGALATSGTATTTLRTKYCLYGNCHDPILDGPGSWGSYTP